MKNLNHCINIYLESCKTVQERPARTIMRHRVTSLLITRINRKLPGLKLQALHTGSLREGLGTGLGRPDLFRRRSKSQVGVAFRHPLSSDVDLMLIATAAPVDGVLIKMTPVPGNPALVTIQTSVAALAELPEELHILVMKQESRPSPEAVLLTEVLTVAGIHGETETDVPREVSATVEVEVAQQDTNYLRVHLEDDSLVVLPLLARFVLQALLLEMSGTFLPPLLQCDVAHHGPAAELKVLEFSPRQGYTTEYLADFLFSLPVTDWPESTLSFFTRERLWPKQEVMIDILRAGFHIVPKGETFEWRLSFSLAEVKLSDAMPEAAKDTLRLAKTVFKMLQSSHSTNRNSTNDMVEETPWSSLCSYHIKTCFFHMMETMPEDTWTAENIPRRLLEFLKKLASVVKDKELHHLFLREVNLFEAASYRSCDAISRQLMEIRRDQDWLCEILSIASQGSKAEQDYAYAHGEALPKPSTAETRRLQRHAEVMMNYLVRNVDAVTDLSPVEPSTNRMPLLPFLTGRVIPNPGILVGGPSGMSMDPLDKFSYEWILPDGGSVKRAPPLNPEYTCGYSRKCCHLTLFILFLIIVAIFFGVPAGLGYFSKKPVMNLESAYSVLHKLNNGRVLIPTVFGHETTPCKAQNRMSQQQCTPNAKAVKFSKWLDENCVPTMIDEDYLRFLRQNRKFSDCRSTISDSDYHSGLIAAVSVLEIQAYQDADRKLRTTERQSVWKRKLVDLQQRMTIRKTQVAELARSIIFNDAKGAKNALLKIDRALNTEKHLFSRFGPLRGVSFYDVATPIGRQPKRSKAKYSSPRSSSSSRSRSVRSASRSVGRSRSRVRFPRIRG